MKIFTTTIVFLLISVLGHGQTNTEFIDSIKRLVIQDKIPVYNAAYEIIKNDEVSRQFVWTDTFINDVWTRPRFVDNIYREAIDGMLIKTVIDLDTFSDKVDSNYLSFFTEDYDDSGNYIKDRIIFKIDKRGILKNTKHQKIKAKSKRILKRWRVSKIRRLGKEIELDSCHQLYRIEFNENSFKQYYLPTNDECFTKVMKNDLIIGVDGDSKDFHTYHNKVNGHYIENRKGKWSILDNKLILESEEGLPIVTFVIQKLNSKKLCLKSEKLQYEVELTKVIH